MISASLQNDLRKANASNRCMKTGGHIYGKTFAKGQFYYKRCKRCKQYTQVVLDRFGNEI